MPFGLIAANRAHNRVKVEVAAREDPALPLCTEHLDRRCREQNAPRFYNAAELGVPALDQVVDFDPSPDVNLLKGDPEGLIEHNLKNAVWEYKVLREVDSIFIWVLRRPVVESAIEGVAKVHAVRSSARSGYAPNVRANGRQQRRVAPRAQQQQREGGAHLQVFY